MNIVEVAEFDTVQVLILGTIEFGVWIVFGAKELFVDFWVYILKLMDHICLILVALVHSPLLFGRYGDGIYGFLGFTSYLQ